MLKLCVCWCDCDRLYRNINHVIVTLISFDLGNNCKFYSVHAFYKKDSRIL